MSHIFEALQKSEGERSETNSSAPQEVTELLQRAEHRTAWKSAALSEQLPLREYARRSTTVGQGLTLSDDQKNEWSEILNNAHCLQVSPANGNRLVCITDDETPAVEGFRLLGVRLRHLRRKRPLKKVLITSTIPQEGKSTVAANLACVLARGTQQRTLLLEGDLRRSTILQLFGLGKHPGLSECLHGSRLLTKSLYRIEGHDLWIMPAGETQSNALELLQLARLSVIMEQLSSWFEWIIIDAPPLLPLADTSVWVRLSDGVLLVTRQGITEKRQLQRGLETIETGKLVGALLNCSNSAKRNDYYRLAYTS